MNKFKQCPKCESKINIRTSRDMLPDGSRRESYRQCRACGYRDTVIIAQEIIFVSSCGDNKLS